MKVVHVLKRIEMIDQDIKELRKLEKSVAKNKSFTTPIFMSIEKQINILLGERVQLFGLDITNPPQTMIDAFEGKIDEPRPINREKPKPKKKAKSRAKSKAAEKEIDDLDDDDIPMLTQDDIDARFDSMEKEPVEKKALSKDPDTSDDSVKLLDLALEKGTLDKQDIEQEKEKKIRFFRDNFPVD